jgi:ribosomal-protein-alanine N-acetyltransferase
MMQLSFNNQNLLCHVRMMDEKDVTQVTSIDRQVFPNMLPAVNYRNELKNALAHYVVACSREGVVDESSEGRGASGFLGVLSWVNNVLGHSHTKESKVVELKQYIFGFAGMWMMADEAHIINIAVREQYRRQGVGELLLIAMVDMAIGMKARFIVLEVRASNTVAQGLYAKYGFKAVGVRHGYYSDNREDGIMMSTGDITEKSFLSNFEQLRESHTRKWGVESYQIAPLL